MGFVSALSKHSRGVVFVSVLLLAACAFKTHEPYDPGTANAFPRADLPPVARFAPPSPPPEAELRELREESPHYDVSFLDLPSVGQNGQVENRVTAHYYQSRLPGPKGVVIVLPIWGSFTYPSNKMTQELLDRSAGHLNVIKVLGEHRIFDWQAMRDATQDQDAFQDILAAMADRIRTTVIDIRRLVQWAAARPEANSDEIALIGFSYGAVIAGIAVGHEPRLAATVLVFGSAHPHTLLAKCPTDWALALQKDVEANLGWDQDQFEARAQPFFAEVDPATYPGRADPAKVLMIDAIYDDCMPGYAREALWDVLGRPERISVYDSHQNAFFAMTPIGFNWLPGQVYGFLEKRLNGTSGVHSTGTQ